MSVSVSGTAGAADVPESWLETIHQQWVATLDAIRDAIVVIGASGQILRANRRFAELTGQAVQDVVGQDLTAVAPWLVDDEGAVSVWPTQTPSGSTVRARLCETDPRLVGQVFILDDVTAENAIAAAEERLRAGKAKSCSDTIQTLLQAQSLSDPYTSHHAEAVARISRRLALMLRNDHGWAEGVYLGALIHDIGKISVPSSILNRPGKLAQAEFNLIRMHPETGYSVVKGLDFPWPVHEIVLQHHERLDGSGYPAGLQGDQVSLAARIVAAADVLEAMSAHRPYRPALGVEAALQELTEGSGTEYDARVVAACVELVTDGLDFAFAGNELGTADEHA